MLNHQVHPETVNATLQATFYQGENHLELSNDRDQRLIDYFGVEDEEDAVSRLSQTLGSLAEHVQLETLA